MTALSDLYDETLRKLRKEMNRLKEVGIGLLAGIIYVIASGWLYFVTVMAR